MAVEVPKHLKQTNNAREALAILLAIQTANPQDHLEILSDSKITIDRLTTHLRKREDKGWIGAKNQEIFKAITAQMRARKGFTILKKVKGHSGVEGNEQADELAKEETQKKESLNKIYLTPTEGFHHTRAKLSKATQALLYRGILERKPCPVRRGMAINLDKARWVLKEANGDLPSDGCIWKSMKDSTITKESRALLWKATHNAYKIGNYWEKIPGYEHRGWCPKCNTTKSMEHILTECKASGQRQI
ncbi:hypothetical protein J132_11175 [Termitomyces sp. J132]|nr:hypothetical protein J132_11175 [Termitomyces sp. J132]